MRSSFSRRGARLTGVQSCPEATGFRKGPAGSAQPGALPLFLLPCAASSRPKPSSPCVGEASGLCIRPGSVGLALAGIGSGWGGGRGGEEGPDNKGDIQGLCWSRARRMESYSLPERPALAGQSGPYKEMLFSLSQWGWDGALCPQDRAALVGGSRGATRPWAVSGWELGLSMGHFCMLSIPSQPQPASSPHPLYALPLPSALG